MPIEDLQLNCYSSRLIYHRDDNFVKEFLETVDIKWRGYQYSKIPNIEYLTEKTVNQILMYWKAAISYIITGRTKKTMKQFKLRKGDIQRFSRCFFGTENVLEAYNKFIKNSIRKAKAEISNAFDPKFQEHIDKTREAGELEFVSIMRNILKYEVYHHPISDNPRYDYMVNRVPSFLYIYLIPYFKADNYAELSGKRFSPKYTVSLTKSICELIKNYRGPLIQFYFMVRWQTTYSNRGIWKFTIFELKELINYQVIYLKSGWPVNRCNSKIIINLKNKKPLYEWTGSVINSSHVSAYSTKDM